MKAFRMRLNECGNERNGLVSIDTIGVRMVVSSALPEVVDNT